MNKIGFKNFRRFVDFPVIDYGNINFLVGRNNSGKSTLVKALLLIVDYLKSDNVKFFSFSKKNIEDVNIVTYGRAKSKGAKDDFIEFTFQYKNFNFIIRISGKEDSTVADVQYLKVEELIQGFSFVLNPVNSHLILENKGKSDEETNSESENLLNSLLKQEIELKTQGKSIKNKASEEYIKLTSELTSLKKKIKEIKSINSARNITVDNFSLETDFNATSLIQVIEDAIIEFNSEYEVQYHDIQKGKKPKKDFANYKAFKESKFKIEKIKNELIESLDSLSIIYLGATLNKQSALFAIRDKHNALSQAIHEFEQLRISPGEAAHRFVTKWMAEIEFEVGDYFETKMHAGEAYEVVVASHGYKIPLADKGMGSIQAMLLIIRLATIIHRKQKDKKDYTIIIEEPELNLHPALQSKLADLFHFVFNEFGINVIVETHSEYIIRKSQVIVVKNEYQVAPNVNPFVVYYFPKDNTPYKLNYDVNGRFDKNFGSGFFDEATNSTMTILKLGKKD